MKIKGFKLTKAEIKIYKAIMRSFPETSPLTAIDAALAGGTRHNFICR